MFDSDLRKFVVFGAVERDERYLGHSRCDLVHEYLVTAFRSDCAKPSCPVDGTIDCLMKALKYVARFGEQNVARHHDAVITALSQFTDAKDKRMEFQFTMSNSIRSSSRLNVLSRAPTP